MKEYMEKTGSEGPGANAMEDISGALADAKRGATRVKEIVETLRSFSRASSKGRREDVSLEGSLAEALRLAEPGYRNVVDVEADIDGTLVVSGDRGLLGQVWINLLMNALEAAGDGGKVSIRAYRSGDEAVVRFRDTGPGVPDDVREKIFEPFFSGKEDGVGLGLSLSYDIIQGHGGEISVESEEGEGACFEVRLPISRE
jgi:signal transduction histidine kinase